MTPNHPRDEDGVLTPEELSMDDDDVRDLGDDRYVVETEGTPQSRSAGAAGERSAEDEAPVRRLAAASEAYGAHVVVRTPDGLASHEVRSDDVSAAFEATMRWYAAQIDPHADPGEVLGTLFEATDIDL